MGEGKDQRFQDSWSQYDDHIKNSKDQLAKINEDHGDNSINMSYDDHSSSSTSSLGDSTISNGSFSSLDTRDDASSSSPYSSFSNSTDSLYDLSELMTQLPLKRGISKFYDGKSESFTSLSSVTSIDDLKKKETHYKRKRKGSKSYQGGLDAYKSFTLPKPIITKKKTPRSSLSSSSLSTRRIMSPKPPQIPSQKDLRCRTFLQ